MKKSTWIVLVLAVGAILSPMVCLAGINDDLIRAATDYNVQKVSELISQGADVNYKDPIGIPVLSRAVGDSNIETLKLLIEKGADVNGRDKMGFTPLMTALTFFQEETAKLLIAKGADVNAKADNGATPLSIADDNYCSDEIIQALKDAGAH